MASVALASLSFICAYRLYCTCFFSESDTMAVEQSSKRHRHQHESHEHPEGQDLKARLLGIVDAPAHELDDTYFEKLSSWFERNVEDLLRLEELVGVLEACLLQKEPRLVSACLRMIGSVGSFSNGFGILAPALLDSVLCFAEHESSVDPAHPRLRNAAFIALNAFSTSSTGLQWLFEHQELLFDLSIDAFSDGSWYVRKQAASLAACLRRRFPNAAFDRVILESLDARLQHSVELRLSALDVVLLLMADKDGQIVPQFNIASVVAYSVVALVTHVHMERAVQEHAMDVVRAAAASGVLVSDASSLEHVVNMLLSVSNGDIANKGLLALAACLGPLIAIEVSIRSAIIGILSRSKALSRASLRCLTALLPHMDQTDYNGFVGTAFDRVKDALELKMYIRDAHQCLSVVDPVLMALREDIIQQICACLHDSASSAVAASELLRHWMTCPRSRKYLLPLLRRHLIPILHQSDSPSAQHRLVQLLSTATLFDIQQLDHVLRLISLIGDSPYAFAAVSQVLSTAETSCGIPPEAVRSLVSKLICSLSDPVLQSDALLYLSMWLRVDLLRCCLYSELSASHHRGDSLCTMFQSLIDDDDWEKQLHGVEAIAAIGLADLSMKNDGIAGNLMLALKGDELLEELRCGDARLVRVAAHQQICLLQETMHRHDILLPEDWNRFSALLSTLRLDELIAKDSLANVYGEQDVYPDPRSLQTTLDCY